MARFDRFLSLGASETKDERLVRRVRVANALALLGLVLSVASTPVDALGVSTAAAGIDLAGAAVFASCLVLNARGHHRLGRIVLAVSANVVLMTGALAIGAAAELRTVCFPLVILPFLVFNVSERVSLAVFVALPIAGYFLIGAIGSHAPFEGVVRMYRFYAPALSFATIVAGSAAFALIERAASDKLARERERAAQGARLVALGEMSSGIAHEIRNPLAAISLAAATIAEIPDDPTMVKALGERIVRIVHRADRIVETLRTFTRDASGDPFVTSPIERIVGDSLELCGKKFADHGVKLEVAAIDPKLVVECRSVQMSQVLVNLLSNAFDAVASAPERWVRIEVSGDAEAIEIAVVDSGPGVPDQVRERIFEPFFTTKEPDRGTGIGLSLSRGMVEAHRGTLELDLGAAHTRFVVRLPRAQRPG